MAVDKNKLSAEATRLLQKGQLDKAIRVYERILEADPGDTRALLKIGEIQQKKGDIPAAADTFGRVAEAYGTQGFFLKAVAVYKQMLRLTPDDVRVLERLAQLYQQLGLVSEAMAQLHAIVRWAEKSGDDAKLLEALRRVVEFDPEDVPSSVKLGELYARLSDSALAVEHLRRAADQLKRNNRIDEYGKIAERLSALLPDDQSLARDVASAALARGDARRALQKLQQCYRVDSRQEETLTLLAQVFQVLGQDTKVAAVFRELGRLHEEAGRREQALEAWNQVLQLEPDDPDAVEAIASAASETVPLMAEGPGSGRAAAPGPASGSEGRVGSAPSPSAAPGSAPAPGRPDVAKLLSETDVYVKYGLHEKALEHLQKVFATEPDNVDAHEKASRIRELGNDLPGAAESQVLAVEGARARGLIDRARAAFERLRQLAPSHAAVGQLGPLLEGDPLPSPKSPETDGLVLEVDELVVDSVEEPASTEDEAVEEARAEQSVAATPTDAKPMDVERDDLAISAVAPAGDELVEGDFPNGEPSQIEPREAPVPSEAIPAAPAVSAGGGAETERERALAQDLAEAEFFESQGLLAEARALLTELREGWPDHPEIATRLARLEERSATEDSPVRAPRARTPVPTPAQRAIIPPAPSPDYLYSVRDVLEPFKKGIEQTITPSDTQTHYDLGIAYKEMSLYEDAIHEFEVALQGSDRTRQFDCLMLIGLCRIESGDAASAIEAFRTALAGDPAADQRRALEYQLAVAYEAAGDTEAAAHFLNGLVAVDPEYRDARERLAALGGGPGRAPPASDVAGPVSGTPASVRRGR